MSLEARVRMGLCLLRNCTITHSIRVRLLVWLIATLAIFLGFAAWMNYLTTLQATQLAYDRLLVTSAHALADLIRLERGQLIITLPHAALEIYDHNEAIKNVSGAHGRMLYRVSFIDGRYIAGDQELTPHVWDPTTHSLFKSMIDLYDLRDGPEPMRIAALLQPIESFDGSHLVVVQVAESSAYRDALKQQIFFETLWHAMALLLALIALIWTVTTLALRPLGLLTQQLNVRSPSDLAPLRLSPAPTELTHVILGFNNLLQKLTKSLEQQRRFVADASHQLRTPLAVLQLHADAGLHGDISANEALSAVSATTRRATRLAEQLLSLARAQQTVTQEPPETLNLRDIASEVAVELSPLIAQKFQEFQFDCVSCCASTYRWMLREILSNLLKNAIEFTREKGNLGVRLEHEDDFALFTVWDTGPGLSLTMQEQVFRPFATDGQSRGAGLGLVICHDLAHALGASLTLTNLDFPNRGLQAQLRLPIGKSNFTDAKNLS